MALLGFVQGFIIPSAVSLISSFELFFVNTVGLPFNYGTVIYFILLISLISYGIYYTEKQKKKIWNTAILSLMMLLFFVILHLQLL